MTEPAPLKSPAPPEFLDRVLLLSEAAAWLRMSERELAVKSRGGKKARIPGFWINQRVVRFHPRTVLAKMAADQGVPFEVIAAAFAVPQNK